MDPEEHPSPLRCTAKSAEAIDGKGVGSAPLLKRVRNDLKTNEMDRERTPRLRSGQESVGSRLKGKELDTHVALGGIERIERRGRMGFSGGRP